MAFHLDPGGGIAWIDTDDHTLPADPQVQVQTAVVDRDRKHTKRFRPVRGQDDAVGPGLQPGEAALHQVDGAGHGRQVDALGRGAALDVGDVGLQRLLEELHRAVAVGPGEHPGVHDAAERGSVGGAGQVVVHHVRHLVGHEAVAEPLE